MTYEFITTQQEEGVFTITLNRPEKRNALNDAVVSELKKALEEGNNDQNRVIIFKGNGEAFCAGADLAYLKTLQNNTLEENLEDSRHLMELFKMIYHYPKLTIAQVEGHAIAGGCGLATVCDIIFSIPEAKFGYTEVGIGFIPAIVSVFLIKKIGEAKARELLLTGKLVNAEVVKSLGLINFIEEKENIELSVKDFVRKFMSRTSPQAIALTKRLISDVQDIAVDNAFDLAAQMNAEARMTMDCKKGIGAFLNKEKITW